MKNINDGRTLEEIKVKKSKYERVLKLSNDEIIAKAIQDILKRDKENDNFKNRKK